MARLAIEDQWWTDPRRDRLAEIVGGHEQADISTIRAWRLAQEFWKRGRGLVPRVMFEALKNAQALIDSGLAEPRGEQVYIRGTGEHLEWTAQQREKAAAAGKKSAKRARDARGRLLKSSSKHPTPTNADPAPANEAQRSVSVSVFVSGSQNEEYTSCVDASPTQASSVVQSGKNQNPAPGGKRSKFDEPTRAKMRAFIAAYADGYRKKYGGPPEGIRDKAIIGKVGHWIESLSQERAIQLVEVYLQIDHRWIDESQHDLWQFFRNLNRIGNALNSGRNPSDIDWATVFGSDP